MTETKDHLRDFAPTAELVPETTCLVLIDLQYATGCRTVGLGRILAEEHREDEGAYRFDRIERHVVPNAVKLLDGFRRAGMRRVHVTLGSEVSDFSDVGPQLRRIMMHTNNRAGQREHEILDELAPLPEEKVVNKLSSSAFQSSELGYVLRHWGIQTLVFGGLSTQMCVEATLRDASDLGFGCVLAEDASGSDSEQRHLGALATIRRHYGVIMSTDDILERLGATTTAVR